MATPSNSPIQRATTDPRTVALIAVGGAAGASVRWAVATLVGADGTFPVATFLVNLVGCLLLGALVGRSERITLGVGVGFCGGLTTMSTFAVEVASLLDSGAVSDGILYLTASVVGGIGAVLVGRRLTFAGATP